MTFQVLDILLFQCIVVVANWNLSLQNCYCLVVTRTISGILDSHIVI